MCTAYDLMTRTFEGGVIECLEKVVVITFGCLNSGVFRFVCCDFCCRKVLFDEIDDVAMNCWGGKLL